MRDRRDRGDRARWLDQNHIGYVLARRPCGELRSQTLDHLRQVREALSATALGQTVPGAGTVTVWLLPGSRNQGTGNTLLSHGDL